MNILVIDTSTELEYIGATIAGKKTEKAVEIPRTHAASLFQNIDEVLAEAGGTLKDIDLIATGIGPGSFTGIRIAVTTARMLAQLAGTPLMGLYSQDMFALGTPLDEGEYLLIAFDAKKNRVFGALYQQINNRLECIVTPGDYTIDFLAKEVTTGSPVVTTGSGIDRFHDTISELLPEAVFKKDIQPEINALVKEIEERFRENPEACSSLNQVTPCYARRSDAEIAMEKRKKS